MLLNGPNPQNKSHIVLNKAFQLSKTPFFSRKTANQNKILQKLEETPKKLSATEAQCLAVPPICVEKKPELKVHLKALSSGLYMMQIIPIIIQKNCSLVISNSKMVVAKTCIVTVYVSLTLPLNNLLP